MPDVVNNPNNSSGTIVMGKTIAVSTGAQTQSTQCGQVQFAAASPSLVVTNSLVNSTSLIMVTQASNDANSTGVWCQNSTPAAGQFTIYTANAPAATMKVNYLIL